MTTVFIGLLVFVVGYSVTNFLLSLVPPLSKLQEVLSIAVGAVLAMVYLGAF